MIEPRVRDGLRLRLPLHPMPRRRAAIVAALAALGVEQIAWAQDAGSPDAASGQPSAAPPSAAQAPAARPSPTPPSAATAEISSSTEMPEVVVRGRAEDLLGVAVSASQGAVGEADMKDLPLLRRGELLETVPGMVVTQHSGDGKANQYFLRGFNLDHGTDFAFSVDGVPVNLPSHAHGQGYSDLNFMIPELVDFIDFKKGPFYPEVGDFSGAGAADIHLVNKLPQGLLNLEGGEFGYVRALVAASPTVGPGTLLYAFEYNHYNGPWVLPERSNRYNGLLRYHWGDARDQVNVTASVYAAPEWHSTDQVALRAINQGLISRFGALDPSDGGNTGRGALSFNWIRHDDDTTTKLTVYAFYYRLNLFSNFTYFLTDRVNGDQFEQIDRRFVSGGDLKRISDRIWFGKNVENTVGVQIRNDIIPHSGLDHTANRQVLDVEIDDRIEEFSAGVYANNQIQWTDWFKSELGVRADVVAIDVNSDTAANSGNRTAGIVNPKASLIFGPWKKTEFYLDVGSGFHSNDARGVTVTVDPTTMDTLKRVPLLVRTAGAELGTRTSIVPGLVSTLSLWFLQSDSELTFAGDAGDTQPNGKSRKYGVEWANFYKLTPWLTFTGDVSLTHARYVDDAIVGIPSTYIANSIPLVVSAVATVEAPIGIYASARLRYFSSQPLVEDDSVRQPESTLVDAKVGYRRGRFEVFVDLLNLLDSKADDIAYYYASRLAGEPVGSSMNDLHVHPVEPFEVRAGVTVHY
jgi:hypothetical protein